MEYCPRCRKLVNVNIQEVNLDIFKNVTYFCEVCGITIRSIRTENGKGENHGKNKGKLKQEI